MNSPKTAAHKLISSHLLSGEMVPGEEIGLKIDHALQQDATGTLVMLELEALGLSEVKAEKAVQYVDHNLLQTDSKNPDDHAFLRSAARKFGYWYSMPGNGISHAVHMERFGIPGKSMIGSDSHTCAAGGLGMLAIGTGGLDVALAAVGEPFYVKMPKVMGIELKGKLSEWVSAKDVVLEMLRRYDVDGGRGYIFEYYGDGVKNLSTWDRHVIANMGTEMGATATVFPSDEITRSFMEKQGRGSDWVELKADPGAKYDAHETIELGEVVPLVAMPSSPGNVVPVSEQAGLEVNQVVVGSSANPGLRDFWIVAALLDGEYIPPSVSLDINPSSRQVIQDLSKMGAFSKLIEAGARFHQSGCLGCIGMGQAPASGTVSLRTMPRNFPGRSGTLDDQVYLCSPETAAATAIMGKLTDPRDLEKLKGKKYPKFKEPETLSVNESMMLPPAGKEADVELIKGPNIKSLPDFGELEDSFDLPVLLKMGDDISTDSILKAGAEVLPLRSNIPEISKWSFSIIDETFYDRAMVERENGNGHVVVVGDNYAQGSSREHAALAPRYLGQKAVIAKSYSRIGWQNLVNFGIIPFEFKDLSDYYDIAQGDLLAFSNLRETISENKDAFVRNMTKGSEYVLQNTLSPRQIDILLKGGTINFLKEKLGTQL